MKIIDIYDARFKSMSTHVGPFDDDTSAEKWLKRKHFKRDGDEKWECSGKLPDILPGVIRPSASVRELCSPKGVKTIPLEYMG